MALQAVARTPGREQRVVPVVQRMVRRVVPVQVVMVSMVVRETGHTADGAVAKAMHLRWR